MKKGRKKILPQPKRKISGGMQAGASLWPALFPLLIRERKFFPHGQSISGKSARSGGGLRCRPPALRQRNSRVHPPAAGMPMRTASAGRRKEQRTHPTQSFPMHIFVFRARLAPFLRDRAANHARVSRARKYVERPFIFPLRLAPPARCRRRPDNTARFRRRRGRRTTPAHSMASFLRAGRTPTAAACSRGTNARR